MIVEFTLFGGAFAIGITLLGRHRRRRKTMLAPGERLIFANLPAIRALPLLRGRMPAEWQWLAGFFDNALIDRTLTLDRRGWFDPLDPLPDGGRALASAPRRELPDLCRERALALLDEAERRNCRIDILWSGGIDSTTALLALLAQAEPRGDTRRLRVVYNRRSVAEYPWLFEHVLEPKLELRRFRGRLGDALDPDQLTITGELGDQLFGSAKVEAAIADGVAWQPWQDKLPGWLAGHADRECSPESVLRFVKPLIDRAPLPIVSVYDWLWWLNFTAKWQLVDLRIAASVKGDVGRQYRQMRHFFRTDDFQSWSLQHHDEKIATDWRSYKQPLKALIADLTGDSDYARDKLKVASLQTAGGKNWLAQATLLTNGFECRRMRTLGGGSNGE